MFTIISSDSSAVFTNEDDGTLLLFSDSHKAERAGTTAAVATKTTTTSAEEETLNSSATTTTAAVAVAAGTKGSSRNTSCLSDSRFFSAPFYIRPQTIEKNFQCKVSIDITCNGRNIEMYAGDDSCQQYVGTFKTVREEQKNQDPAHPAVFRLRLEEKMYCSWPLYFKILSVL